MGQMSAEDATAVIITANNKHAELKHKTRRNMHNLLKLNLFRIAPRGPAESSRGAGVNTGQVPTPSKSDPRKLDDHNTKVPTILPLSFVREYVS
jgi:hypothetical protein